MANFDSAFQKIIAIEGGYVNDPDDEGGETYKGIARKFWAQWEGWLIIDECKKKPNFPFTLEVSENLQVLVKSFYKVNFWDKVLGDYIIDQNVAFNLFDFAVNAGVEFTIKVVQKTIGAKVDGIFGKISLGLLNEYDKELFFAKFDLAKIAEYIKLVDEKPVKIKYFFGWIKRVINN